MPLGTSLAGVLRTATARAKSLLGTGVRPGRKVNRIGRIRTERRAKTTPSEASRAAHVGISLHLRLVGVVERPARWWSYSADVSPEVSELVAALDAERAGVLNKLAGLSDQDARRSTVKSGTNLAGLVQHLTFVESMWFEEIVAGGKARRGLRSMTVDPSVPVRKLRAEYRVACQASNEIVAAVGDAEAPVIRNGKRHNLRWVIVGVIQETARHAGHADIIREQIDGKTRR